MTDGSSLRANSIGYAIGRQTILDGVTVDFRPGELTAVSGPSGSGKTTLLLLIAGLAKPKHGSVHLGGQKIGDGLVARRERVGFVFQHFGLIPYLTAAENVAVALDGHATSAAPVENVIRQALDEVGLADVADRLAQDLSGGQQQRVAVARALAGSPYVVIADEPTSELDAENRERILSLLRRRAAGGGIVVVSSDDKDVISACDRLLLLADGKVSETGRPASDLLS